MHLHVSKKQSEQLQKAILSWQKSKIIDAKLAKALKNTIEIIPFNWRLLAQYAFWIAISCIIISVTAVLTDQYLIAFFKKILHIPHGIRTLSLGIISAGFYWWGMVQRRKYPERIFSTEAKFLLGIFTMAGAITKLGYTLNLESNGFSWLLLIACVMYGILGYVWQSKLIWLFFIVSLGGWIGMKTGYLSGWESHYLGMNYPLRFAIFGSMLTITALYLQQFRRFFVLKNITLITGLLYLFIALWALSIFGNYGELTVWLKVKQIKLFYWSILFAITAGLILYHGLRYNNSITKGFGITFLLINLYTRYFEYGWNHIHKAILFAFLGISFWALGRYSEKMFTHNN